MQIVGGRKSDRMQQEVQLTPFTADPRESLLQLAGNAHITYQQQLAAEGIGDSVDIRPRLVVQIGCGDFSTRGNEGTRTTGGNAGSFAMPTTRPRLPCRLVGIEGVMTLIPVE